MAEPVQLRFGKFRVLLGNGATPEVFSAPCGFTEKAFQRSKELSDTTVPDCDDPDAAAWTGREVRSLSASITGSGVLAKSALPIWEEAFESIEPVNCRVELLYTGETRTYAGRFHLSSFEITGSLGEKAQISVSMESDGPIVLTTT